MNLPTVQDIINEYNYHVKGIEEAATKDTNRAYGGTIRSAKGQMVESIARSIIEIAWSRIDADQRRLSFDRSPIKIPIQPDYKERIQIPEVKDWIRENEEEFCYKLKTDVHVHIDRKFVLGIECKAYAENAMFKRILVDFQLLKTKHPDLECALFQLESQLTGDYSSIHQPIIYGSHTSHTLQSYFGVNLHIITLLPGERKVERPIHKPDYFKELTPDAVERAISAFEKILIKSR